MNIREMRAQLGDTQSEFSARYHIPFRTVQNWETGMRKPPEYVADLLEQRIKEDLTNRKTLSLPKYDPQKKDLPSRSSYVGALSWLQAVRDCIGEPVVFALDNALMCQGNFGGRSDEYIVWVYGDDSVMKFNGVVVLGNRIGAQNIKNRNGLLYTDFNRTVYLTAKDDPATIPTADFEREGRTYTLLDLLKNDQTETDTREHIEVVTLESKTKDMTEILKMLEPKLEVKTEDGYEGVLSLDHTTIQVEAAGYGTSSRTVTAERTYPNLSDADVSLVPKSVNENGRTLTLADVSWQEAAVDPTDGYDIPIRYTAVASYTGTATSKYATGYTVTADYKGDVTRTSCDTVIYTAVFSSVGAAASAKSGVDFNWLWLLLPVGAAALGGCGYAGYKGYRHYINKKRGYAA